MTHNDIYTKFMIEYDKANITSSYPSLTEYEIATILDKAYLAIIAQKLTGNNTRKASFESDTKAIEDIRPLETFITLTPSNTQTHNHIKNSIDYDLPDTMLYYVQGQVLLYNNIKSIDKKETICIANVSPNVLTDIGISSKSDEDEFNAEIGRALAFYRANM